MKKKFFSILIIFLFIVSTTLFYANAKNIKNDTVDVEIKNITTKKITSDHSFVGVNWYWDNTINSDIFSNPVHVESLIKTLSESKIDIIRYPGGENVLHKFWDIPNGDIYKALKISYWTPTCQLNLKSFLQFCRKAGLKATIQVNTHNFYDKQNNTVLPLKNYETYNSLKNWESGKVNWELVEKAAKYAADEVKWVNDNGYSDIVKYWELGNEDYAKGKLNCSYTGSEYGKVAAKFISEMKKSDPNIKMLVTTIAEKMPNPLERRRTGHNAYGYDWNKSVVNSPELINKKNEIFAGVFHNYSFLFYKNLNLNNYSEFSKSILQNPLIDMNDKLNTHKNNLKNSVLDKAVFFVNEFNATDYHNSQYSHSWLGALGNAKMILSCASNPYCYHMDYHALLNFDEGTNDTYQNTGYGLLHYAKYFQEPFIKYPIANVISFLNENIKGDILGSTYSSSNVDILTTRNNNYLNIIVLNLGKDSKINLKLNGFKNPKYIENKSLGINIPEKFTAMDTYDSMSNPSEVRQINELKDAIIIKKINQTYTFDFPINTLSVFTFKIQQK